MTGPERQRPLDGMPLALGDMFICKIDYGDELAGRRRLPRGEAPAAAPKIGGLWLVLRACYRCRPPSAYCPRHWVRTTAEQHGG